LAFSLPELFKPGGVFAALIFTMPYPGSDTLALQFCFFLTGGNKLESLVIVSGSPEALI
jgi:hypothetical protein